MDHNLHEELETRIRPLELELSKLKKHVEEQDAIIYGQSKKIEKLEQKLVDLQNEDSEGPPANEKPPHY